MERFVTFNALNSSKSIVSLLEMLLEAGKTVTVTKQLKNVMSCYFQLFKKLKNETTVTFNAQIAENF